MRSRRSNHTPEIPDGGRGHLPRQLLRITTRVGDGSATIGSMTAKEPTMKKKILIAGLLVFIAVLYVASIGPAWALTKQGHISKPAFLIIYAPLAVLEDHCPGDNGEVIAKEESPHGSYQGNQVDVCFLSCLSHVSLPAAFPSHRGSGGPVDYRW